MPDGNATGTQEPHCAGMALLAYLVGRSRSLANQFVGQITRAEGQRHKGDNEDHRQSVAFRLRHDSGLANTNLSRLMATRRANRPLGWQLVPPEAGQYTSPKLVLQGAVTQSTPLLMRHKASPPGGLRQLLH